MSRYNRYFLNHFSDCRLIVEGFDEHRQRKVQVRLIPGEFDVVGISDGVDAWVAPVTVAPSYLFDKVRRIIHDLMAGKNPPAIVSRPRVKVALETPPQQPSSRRRVHVHS